MAHSPQPLPLYKHAIPSSPPLNPNPHFTPRKEFIRDQRIISSFSLLALSGPGLVRLYSFPGPVISALRRLFDQQNLIISVREHAPKNFFEFTLDRKPWANAKNIESERLIVSILTTVMQCGFTFLSTIDYGREQDDRVTIAFSRPLSIPSTATTFANGSATTLAQSSRVHFAISFASTTVLRVIDPPLHSTPAILQAVRGAWPRGVVSEKTVGDATYEFKLKGYKWFQEDNFPTDSLHHMLTLLTSLDAHAFSLLTSLSLANRSRVKDLWIFTGPSEDPESNTSSPAPSSVELKRDSNPPTGVLTTPNEKLAPVGAFRVLPGNAHPYSDAHYTHVRSASDTTPATSSPLNPASASGMKGTGGVLRKVMPKLLPLAFTAEMDSPQIASTSSRSPVDQNQHPFASSVGSLDMTGIGSGLGRLDLSHHSITPEVLYATPAHHHSGSESSTRHVSAAAQDTGAPHEYGTPFDVQPVRTSTPPPAGVPTILTSPPTPQSQSSSHALYTHTAHDHSYQSGHAWPQDQDLLHNRYGAPRGPAPDTPRSPTPPLLTPGLFRDSAYASTVGRSSHEISFAYTGREPEGADTSKRSLADIREQDEHEGRMPGAARTDSDADERERPRERRLSGPRHPEAWTATPVSTPKDQRRYDDVARNMLPPTIKEHPSQELDDLERRQDRIPRREETRAAPSPLHGEPVGEGARVNTAKSRPVLAPAPAPAPAAAPATTRPAQNGAPRRISPTRRDTDTSGWVLVNIQGHDKGRDGASSPLRDRTTAPNGAPMVSANKLPRFRSSSDSRVPRAQDTGSPNGGAAATSSMSAAAKAIVMIDAVGAKERQTEKSAHGLGFRRIFARSKERHSDSAGNTAQRSRTPEGGALKRANPQPERDGGMGSKDKWRSRATAAASRTYNKRLSVN